MRDRVLFVDDDRYLLESVQRNFRRNFDCTIASSADEAFRLMQEEEPFSIVVADYRMPGENGISFLQKTLQMFPDTIRVMLTGYADMETAVQAINKSRVFSFLQKPFQTSDLYEVITSALHEHRRLQKMHLDSLTDALTGLYNRRFIEKEFHRLLELARRHGQNFALVFADVNDFKQVNDVYGHATGDELLSAISDSLQNTCRGTDIVCRYGGDEFLILLEASTNVQAQRLIERIHEAIGALRLESTGTKSYDLSLGYSAFPDDGDSIEQLLTIADQRMYSQKAQIKDPRRG